MSHGRDTFLLTDGAGIKPLSLKYFGMLMSINFMVLGLSPFRW